MIFQRALRRELLSAAGAVFTTLFTITITVMLIKILGQAAGGIVASQDVLALIGFQTLNYLPILLILTSFISVLLVITRSYQDSEMVVWFSCGLSLTQWIAPILRFGLPLVLLTTILSFAATPWANRQSNEYRARFAQREDIAKISPGKFQESASGNRIFFVESVAIDSPKIKNVFVDTMGNGRDSVVVAREGSVSLDAAGDKFLILDQGRRYDGVTTQPDFKIMSFERYGVLVASQSNTTLGDQSARALPTMTLLQNQTPINLAELLWRVALPLMNLLLPLLAIPLAFVNPRGGRSANLMIALLLFVVYSNMVSVLQGSVAQARLSFGLGWWPVHLITLSIVTILFVWRVKGNSRFHPASAWARLKRHRSSKSAI
ncbi:MAG: LPS export ABC transporter permease LptF [Herbaspirillum sp.]